MEMDEEDVVGTPSESKHHYDHEFTHSVLLTDRLLLPSAQLMTKRII